MTKTCRYRRRGKICRKRAGVTLIGYVASERRHASVLLDVSVKMANSYCSHCAGLIARRCAEVTFMDNNHPTLVVTSRG